MTTPANISGGGSATHSGTNYQNCVAAWMAVRILAEQSASPPWDLPTSTCLSFVRCETAEPVDDILVGTSNSGHSFIQAKHTISLGTTAESEFGSVIEQFIRQFHAHGAVELSPSWSRPLDKDRDRLVLTTSSGSSGRVREVLPTILCRIRALLPHQPASDAAASDEDRAVLETLQNHIVRCWGASKGVDPNSEEIREVCKLIWVQTLNVDPDEDHEREAKDLLRAVVLKNPADADLAWARLVQACGTYAANHSGASRSEIQQLLISAGIDLHAVDSYRADIEKLKDLSANTTRALSLLSNIRVTQTETVKLLRPSTLELRNAALTDSIVVVGQPGAGKSGALHDLARALEADGDVVTLAVDQFDSGSLGSLRNEIGISHELLDLLKNWPGTKPGFLIIDALDASRTEAGAKVFRELIRTTIAAASRWRVIPSIRKFDLRYSTSLRAMFSGDPPSVFQDPEFSEIRHLEVQILSDAELMEVSRQSASLGAVISGAGQDLLKLLRTPFNLRLIAELIGSGIAVASLTPIRTQIELLERYWRERVVGSDAQGDAREAVLRAATAEMVSKRTLRIDRAVVAADPSASGPLKQLLSAQLLTEWQPSPEQAPDRYVITYAHHMLFDYAVARLYFRGPLEQIISRLETEPELFLAVRPSVLLHYQYSWNLNQDRQRFWECVFAFFKSPKIPLTGKILGPIAASQLINALSDCQVLLDAMRNEQSADHAAALETFRHLMGAVHSSHDPTRPLTGPNAPPWCDLLREASGI